MSARKRSVGASGSCEPSKITTPPSGVSIDYNRTTGACHTHRFSSAEGQNLPPDTDEAYGNGNEAPDQGPGDPEAIVLMLEYL